MRRKLTLIVVDDEQPAIDRMMALLGQFIDLVVKATFTDPKNALEYLAKYHVDFVLLDMEMPVINGRAFVLQMPKAIKVILCTAHKDYGTDGFDLGVVDFLLKPVGLERLAIAIDRMKNAVKEPIDGRTLLRNNYYYFMLKGPIRHKRTKIDFDDIVYVEARNDGVCFFLVGNLSAEINRRDALEKAGLRDDGKAAYTGHPSKEKLFELMEIFEGTSFIQIHRSFILNTDFFYDYGNSKVTLKGLEGITLPTGARAHHPEFFKWIDNDYLPEH